MYIGRRVEPLSSCRIIPSGALSLLRVKFYMCQDKKRVWRDNNDYYIENSSPTQLVDNRSLIGESAEWITPEGRERRALSSDPHGQLIRGKHFRTVAIGPHGPYHIASIDI